jgi:hypothetical protein
MCTVLSWHTQNCFAFGLYGCGPCPLASHGCFSLVFFQLQAGGIALLAPLLRSCTGPTSSQLAYEICLCIWQLSYHQPALQAIAPAGVLQQWISVVHDVRSISNSC